MPLLASIVSCLLLFSTSIAVASDCDLGAADVIFLVKASNLMQREDFDQVKQFMKSFSETLDIGRDNTTTHVGAVFFDNVGPPQTRILLTAFSRLSDLQMGIDNLSLLPCGAGWCKEKETSFRPALDYAMSRFPKGRMKKIVLIHSGREEPAVVNEIQDLTSRDPWLRVLHIHIRGNVVKEGDQEATYLAAYHDPYKRYAERMSQLYPNISVPIPPQPTPIPIPKTVEQGRITVTLAKTLLKINDEVCQQLFSCPPCAGIIGGRDPFDKETPLHSKLPENWKTQVSPAKKVNSGKTDDYEYEITADPPGLTINPNPAKNRNRKTVATTTPATSLDYVYEDSIPDSKGVRRSKRALMSPLQRDCTCKAPINFQVDSPPATETVTAKPTEGCSGTSATADTSATGCSGTGATAEAGETGCSGAQTGPSTVGGCGGGQTANVAYAPAQYAQYYQSYPQQYYQYQQQQQQQQQYPQYYQYMSPCRVGNPCQQRSWYYYSPSPCASRSPCSAQQYQYQQYPYQYYGYTYSQTGQQVAQTQSDVYATPSPVLPSVDAVHEGTSAEQKPKDQKKEGFKFDSSIFEKLEKYDKELNKDEKPSDPFSVRAFGGSQFKRIPNGDRGAFDGLVTPASPRIEDILGKILGKLSEPVADETEATIPSRPMALKPVDIGSELSDMEDINLRHRRSIQWGSHPWHSHMYNHMYQHFYRYHQPAAHSYWSTTPTATAARAHAAPLYSPNSLPYRTPRATVPCSVKGTDLAVYIDDVGDMSPSEFNTVKVHVKLLWRMMDSDANSCHEMSRMALLKSSKRGEVLVVSGVNTEATLMPKETIIDYMEHAGCSTRRPVCEHILPRALIMASNLLSMQPSDREKLVIVISSRPSSSLERLLESLVEARDFVAQNNASLIFVALREGNSPVGTMTNLQNLLDTTCKQAPTDERLKGKRKFCPWMPLPIMRRAPNSTQQIFNFQ